MKKIALVIALIISFSFVYAQEGQEKVKQYRFSRVETNGGASEQVNLLYGENPNKAVRQWCKPFNDAGIKTQMLERALNGLRMFPVPKDVRRLMFKVKKAQGVDIARSFCGLKYID